MAEELFGREEMVSIRAAALVSEEAEVYVITTCGLVGI